MGSIVDFKSTQKRTIFTHLFTLTNTRFMNHISFGKTLFISALFITYAGKIMAQDLFPIEDKGKYGFIDKTGKVVINPQFDFAQNFSEDMAVVKVGGNSCFIDKSGKTLFISALFITYAGKIMAQDLFPIEDKGKYGFIDKTGK